MSCDGLLQSVLRFTCAGRRATSLILVQAHDSEQRRLHATRAVQRPCLPGQQMRQHGMILIYWCQTQVPGLELRNHMSNLGGTINCGVAIVVYSRYYLIEDINLSIQR